MNTRRDFIKTGSILGAGMLLPSLDAFTIGKPDFISRRPALSARHFTSEAVEATIKNMKKALPNKELAWMFENCFPNTLDTTVYHELKNGVPDTYVITGDIDAMWLRDSTEQVWPYVPLAAKDPKLRQLLAGVINRQVKCILKDPYANAFYKDETKISEWKDDITAMQPGIHERKWEIDSLCFPVRLAYKYWKTTGDVQCFGKDWKESVRLTVQTFREQQKKTGKGPYSFQRKTSWATDGVPLGGYGYPVKPVGLICSSFRASDDAAIFPFLIPANFFAVVSLRQSAEILFKVYKDETLGNDCLALADEVAGAIQKYGIVKHPDFGEVYAYEVNGFGSFNIMDDAGTPSLLSLPYLNAVEANDPVYQRTRALILSAANPFFFKSARAESIGSPHSGIDMIWPLSIITRALTSNQDAEITAAVKMLIDTHAGTGFIHESFHKDDPSNFTRKWFAWANTLFAELILQIQEKKRHLWKEI
ncbi:glycoside hydrolase family 125 protein [Pedobacter sp. FW305-3-2-15-E-R2A2]|uniref:glycoside hydrolase family 125 protein n=1 Tax=Pedobacter sp. FW305-3-2-15-E-R2A2 TaxID=3140251 RepID=UPI00314046BC